MRVAGVRCFRHGGQRVGEQVVARDRIEVEVQLEGRIARDDTLVNSNVVFAPGRDGQALRRVGEERAVERGDIGPVPDRVYEKVGVSACLVLHGHGDVAVRRRQPAIPQGSRPAGVGRPGAIGIVAAIPFSRFSAGAGQIADGGEYLGHGAVAEIGAGKDLDQVLALVEVVG